MDKMPDFYFLAADKSPFTFSAPLSPLEYSVSEGAAKEFYSMHLNALYDLQKHTYTKAIIQPTHPKDGFKAYCDMVERHMPEIKQKLFLLDKSYPFPHKYHDFEC